MSHEDLISIDEACKMACLWCRDGYKLVGDCDGGFRHEIPDCDGGTRIVDCFSFVFHRRVRGGENE